MIDLADNKQASRPETGHQHPSTVSVPGRSFFIFPHSRMVAHFPWPIWAIGWLAIFKGLVWLATDPNVASPMAEILAAKFIISTIPFVVLGIGVWNLRKWANWGIIALAAADLLFHIVFPGATRQIIGNSYWLLSVALLVCNGPIGDILILLGSPYLIKSAGRRKEFAQDNL